MAFFVLPVIGISNLIEGRNLTENPFSLELCLNRCVEVLQQVCNPHADFTISLPLLKSCLGFVYMRIYKAGLTVLGFNAGGGFVMVRNDQDSWSPPLSIGVGGIGGGFLLGAEVVDCIVLLQTPQAVNALRGAQMMKFGANLSCAIGPNGRDASVDAHVSKNTTLMATYSYSFAKGAFMGGSLEGAYFTVKDKDNEKFYNYKVSSQDLFDNRFPHVPFSARKVEREIQDVLCQRGMYNVSRSLLNLALSDNDASEKWEIATDKSSGRVYYFNRETGETRWDLPPIPVTAL